MKNKDVELIELIYKAFGERKYEEILEHFADDFLWIAADNSPLADRSPYRGVAEIRAGVFERIAAGFEDLRVIADEIFAGEGGRVAVLGYYHGRFRGGDDEFRTQVAHIWTMREGRAVKFQQYLDTLKVSRDAAALSPSK